MEVAGPGQPRGGISNEHWSDTVLHVSGGLAYPSGAGNAFYGRAELGINLGDRHGPQFTLMPFGLEGWGGRHGGGGSLPVTLQVGYRVSVLYAGIGVGVNALSFDQVDDTRGVGALSPLAQAKLGLVFGPVSVLADLRGEYRWQIGRDNLPLVTGGLTLGITFR